MTETATVATGERPERWQFELLDLTRPLTEETAYRLFGDMIAGGQNEHLRAVHVDFISDFSTGNGTVCRFSICDHASTHIDAPIHTVEGAPSLEDVDVSRLFGEAVVLDMYKGHVDYGYTPADFEAAEPRIEEGDIVLIYSGFQDATAGERMLQTYITPESAEWLVERGVKAVGCEPPGIEHLNDGYYVHRWYDKDTPNPPPWPAHQILLKNDVYIIESLTNLERIKGQRVRFAALPLCVPGLSGCPVRAVAWLER